MTQNEMEAPPTKLQVLLKRITAHVFSPVLGLTPIIGSVSEARLMFSVCSLLWQLLSYVVLVISASFSAGPLSLFWYTEH